jgi:hypothetical protein
MVTIDPLSFVSLEPAWVYCVGTRLPESRDKTHFLDIDGRRKWYQIELDWQFWCLIRCTVKYDTSDPDGNKTQSHR